MTVLENIELCDNGYIEVKEETVAQKIRLRTPSYGTVSAQYGIFLASQVEEQPDKTTLTEKDDVTAVQTDVEIVDVVALNPRIAEMIMLLEIKGRIKSAGFKALKIKPTMHENMEKNAKYKIDSKKIEEAPNLDSINEQAELDEPTTELIEMDDSVETKVSKNEVSVAKIEKFANDSEQSETIISPVIVEENNARPVSREVPMVAPERKKTSTEPEKEVLPIQDEESNKIDVKEAPAKDELPNNITDLAAIKEYLERTAKLKREAEQAKAEEAAAKKNAEKAEQEAADRRDEFRKTAERIAAHQEKLIAQKEKSKEKATMYDNKRGEYENESAEYQKAINDMLALIGDSKEENKGKIM